MPAEVNVRWSHTDDLTDAHHAWLDDHERERLRELRRPADRDRFVLGSAVARSLVADLEGAYPAEVVLDRSCPRCDAQHGPVTAPGRDWACSVSHSGSYAVAAAIAGSSTRIGVDLETRCPPDWRDLLARVLAPGEPVPEDAAAFLLVWVQKEAVLKATRHGLSRPMTSVSLSGSGEARQTDSPGPFHVANLVLGPAGIAAAVAVEGGPVRLQIRRAWS